MDEKGIVRFVHGANEQNLCLAGRRVGWARNYLKDALNIAPGAMALLDGQPVGEDQVLPANCTLEFLRTQGRRGTGRFWTPERFAELLQVTVKHVEELIESGLPCLTWGDGTSRIPEDQVDRFLDEYFGFAPAAEAIPPQYLNQPDAVATRELSQGGRGLQSTDPPILIIDEIDGLAHNADFSIFKVGGHIYQLSGAMPLYIHALFSLRGEGIHTPKWPEIVQKARLLCRGEKRLLELLIGAENKQPNKEFKRQRIWGILVKSNSTPRGSYSLVR